MSKKYLKDLTDDELKSLFKNNKDINYYIYDYAYGINMQMQEEEAKELNIDVFDMHDHYNSFYLTTPKVYGNKAPEQVAHNMNSDYMNEKCRVLYEKLNDLMDQYDNLTYDEAEGSTLYQDAGDVCDQLAEALTEQLRAYEDVDEDTAMSYFIDEARDGHMSDWEVTEDNHVIETLYKTYK